MRRGIDKEEGFQEGEIVDRWSKKRVLIALAVLVALLLGGFFALTQMKKKADKILGVESNPQVVDGSSASNSSNPANSSNGNVRLPTKQDADQLLEQAKKELNSLTADNLTSSQAALQKVISDLQKVQTGQESPLNAICNYVCKK